MSKSRNQIQYDSDARRGVKIKGFKLPLAVIEQIETLSKTHNIPQSHLLIEAVELWAKQTSKSQIKTENNQSPHQNPPQQGCPLA